MLAASICSHVKQVALDCLLRVAKDLELEAASERRPFPKDCIDGKLELQGVYVVDEAHTMRGECQLHGSDDGGATILLNASLAFEGLVFVFATGIGTV